MFQSGDGEHRMTHNPDGSELLVDLANGIFGEKVDQTIFQLVHLMREGRGVSRDRVLSGLKAFAAELIDMLMMHGSSPHPVVWCQRVSFSVLASHDGERQFDEYSGAYHRKAQPGWRIANDYSPEEIDPVLAVFDALREKITSIDPGRLGKCPVCGLYFVVRRGGQRKSRACSREHGNTLSARRLRTSPAYLEKGREKNTARVRAMREATKLVRQWIEEGRNHKEREKLLRDWNNKNGNLLGKKAFFNILEKGVVHPVHLGTL